MFGTALMVGVMGFLLELAVAGLSPQSPAQLPVPGCAQSVVLLSPTGAIYYRIPTSVKSRSFGLLTRSEDGQDLAMSMIRVDQLLQGVPQVVDIRRRADQQLLDQGVAIADPSASPSWRLFLSYDADSCVASSTAIVAEAATSEPRALTIPSGDQIDSVSLFVRAAAEDTEAECRSWKGATFSRSSVRCSTASVDLSVSMDRYSLSASTTLASKVPPFHRQAEHGVKFVCKNQGTGPAMCRIEVRSRPHK